MATEMLMRFQVGGKAMACESQADVASDDTLMEDFDPPNYCDIEDFSLGLDIDERSTAPQSGPAAGRGGAAALLTAHSRTRFSQWLDDMKPDAYAAIFDAFSFTKQFDWASPTLFDLCCGSKTLDSISLVKRKLIGGSDGVVMSYAFLRIDFNRALIIGLDWSTGDPIKETCKFIARDILVKYRPQLSDGSLGDVVPGRWQRDVDLVTG